MDFCKKHPKYKGKRYPTSECVQCLKIYSKMKHAPRAPIKPTQKHKDKSKYNRPRDKKIKEEDKE